MSATKRSSSRASKTDEPDEAGDLLPGSEDLDMKDDDEMVPLESTRQHMGATIEEDEMPKSSGGRQESSSRADSRGSSALREMFEKDPQDSEDAGASAGDNDTEPSRDETPTNAKSQAGSRNSTTEERRKSNSQSSRNSESSQKESPPTSRRMSKADKQKQNGSVTQRDKINGPVSSKGKANGSLTSRESAGGSVTSRRESGAMTSRDSKDKKVRISKEAMKKATGREDEEAAPPPARMSEEQLRRMCTPDFRTQRDMVEYDCEIRTDKGGKLFAHRAVLSMWSPVFEELFNQDEFADCNSVIIDLSDQKTEDVSHLLAVIYPPNRPVTEKNVFVLLKMARLYQMQEVTSRCEECLMTKRKPGVDMLLCAQNYNLTNLKQRSIDYLKNVPFWEIERHRRTRELNDATKTELYTACLEVMEEKYPEVHEKARALHIRFDECKKMFSDLKNAFKFEGAKEEQNVIREKVFNRAQNAIDELINMDTIDNMERPYSDPAIEEDIEEEQEENHIANGQY